MLKKIPRRYSLLYLVALCLTFLPRSGVLAPSTNPCVTIGTGEEEECYRWRKEDVPVLKMVLMHK